MQWGIIASYLKWLHENRVVVDVFRDQISNESSFGYVNTLETVSNFTYEFLPMTLLDEEGNYNGLSFIRAEDITRMRWGGHDADTVKRLRTKSSSVPIPPKIHRLSTYPLIKQLTELFRCITVYVRVSIDSEIHVTGEAVNAGGVVLLREHGPMASGERTMWLLGEREIVTRIDADGKREREALRLYGAAT